jgi:hypothetical protein
MVEMEIHLMLMLLLELLILVEVVEVLQELTQLVMECRWFRSCNTSYANCKLFIRYNNRFSNCYNRWYRYKVLVFTASGSYTG